MPRMRSAAGARGARGGSADAKPELLGARARGRDARGMKTAAAVVLGVMSAAALGCVGQVSDVGGGDAIGADAGAGVDARPGAPDAAPGAADAGTPQAVCYSEPVSPEADIADVVAVYGGGNWKDELIEAMDRRHPATGYLLEQQRDDSYFDQFSDSSSWSGMVGWLDTLSHEETHLFNAYHAQDIGAVHTIYMRPDLIFELPADVGFARGEIYDDLDAVAVDGIYAGTYLTGSQGQRGFHALLDELSCYLNELAAVGSVGEYYPGAGVSLRDGSVAFLYFLQVYLQVARTEQPAIYEQLRGTPVYVEAVTTLWLRTHYFLAIADEFPSLGVSDAAYRSLIHRPEGLAEIEMFIGHPVGDSPCLLD